jgi:membrane associated rhomboid family serine protease
MSNPSAALSMLGASLAVLGLILYRQRQVRVVSTRFTLPIVLAGAGCASVAWANPTPLTPAGALVLSLLLAADGVGLGAMRSYTVRVWRDGERWLRQGTWTTIGLWLAGSAIHITVDNATHIGPSNVLLYLGVTYGVQTLVLRQRITKLACAPCPSRTSTGARSSLRPPDPC